MSQRNIHTQSVDGQGIQELFCRVLHHGTAAHKSFLQNGGASAAGVSAQGRPGDPVTPAIVPSSVYFLPGDPAGPYQYAR